MSTLDPGPFHEPPRFTDPERKTQLAKAFPELNGLFTRFAQNHHIPGIAFGVIIDGALAYSSGVGVSDTATENTPDENTVFRIASMTKSFTAMCVLMLRDDGLLGLEDPIVRHVPELRSLRYPTSDSPAVTIRDLLSMSSGLVEDDPWGDRHLGMDSATFSALLASGLGFDLAPATGYEYSNLGYAILGKVVGNVTGMPLRALSQERLFDPLGMTDTTWDADRISPRAAAIGYRLEKGEWLVEPPLADGAFGAMGGIATSVKDLARYVALHLSAWPPRNDDDNGPLRRSSLREMAQAHRAGPTYISAQESQDQPLTFDGYGYGLVSATHPRYGRVVAHSGSLPGFASHMEWLPDHGVGVVALANRTYVPMKAAVREAINALAYTGALLPRVTPPSEALLAVQRAIVGLYEHWDLSTAADVMLDTYFLDLDDDRRGPDFERLRSAYGACLSVGEVRPTGALRGEWRMTCERGTLNVWVMLGPVLPSRVQFIKVSLVDEAKEEGVKGE